MKLSPGCGGRETQVFPAPTEFWSNKVQVDGIFFFPLRQNFTM